MTKTTRVVWDSVSDSVISELDETNTVTATYTNEPQPYGGVISQRRGTTTSTLHADALGTTRALTDNTQTTTDTYLYDAWGNLVNSSGATVSSFRWVGRYGYYQDSGTGLVYVRARMYQPTVARWCSVDPIFNSGKLPYTYSNSNPISRLDPSGWFPCAFSHVPCGTWTSITLTDIVDAIEIASNLTAYWRGGPECSSFKSFKCRCREVGFVQIAKYDYVYMNKWGFGLHYKSDWHIDPPQGGFFSRSFWPYPYPATIGTNRVNPQSSNLLSISDSPGITRTHRLRHTLISLEQEFELCVTCLSIGYPHFDDGSTVHVHTLGCFKWGHYYSSGIDPKTGTTVERFQRYLDVNNRRLTTSNPNRDLDVKNEIVGDPPPSATWQRTVCSALQGLTRSGPGNPD